MNSCQHRRPLRKFRLSFGSEHPEIRLKTRNSLSNEPPLVTLVDLWASVAQLDRASDFGSEGCRFESCPTHHLESLVSRCSTFQRAKIRRWLLRELPRLFLDWPDEFVRARLADAGPGRSERPGCRLRWNERSNAQTCERAWVVSVKLCLLPDGPRPSYPGCRGQ